MYISFIQFRVFLVKNELLADLSSFLSLPLGISLLNECIEKSQGRLASHTHTHTRTHTHSICSFDLLLHTPAAEKVYSFSFEEIMKEWKKSFIVAWFQFGRISKMELLQATAEIVNIPVEKAKYGCWDDHFSSKLL